MTEHITLSGLQGRCPAPFLQEDLFTGTGGFQSGRFCQPVPAANASCCLPCPITDWTYSDGFEDRTKIASWINVGALSATIFMLASFIFLPVRWTHRHYLSVCLVVSILFMELAFIVPLAADPDQCYDEITPNDMQSNLTCAISGAFILFGGWAAVTWVFLRALSLHLQICWQVDPGRRFLFSALAFGWAIPVVGLAIVLYLTGVSYRFGNVCLINHNLGLEDYWGPILTFASLGLVLQFVTIGYCTQVYIKSLIDGHPNTSTTDGDIPSINRSLSLSVLSARQTYRRVKRVVELQWRGAMIVLVIIAEVVFFSIVFVSMDNSSQSSPDLMAKTTPWVECLVLTGGDKTQCLSLARRFMESEAAVLAVLICLGLSGFWCLLFLGRWSMLSGWKDLLSRAFGRKNEYVSADARLGWSTNRPKQETFTPESPAPRITPPLPALSPHLFRDPTPSVEGRVAFDPIATREPRVRIQSGSSSVYSVPIKHFMAS